MRDLYFDDIEDRSYADTMILEDVRALVNSGQREGSVLDYKSDVSEKDTWPATVSAFANSFGGLIVFGVEGKHDQPRRVTGFDPSGVEVKTKLTSMVIDRIQPRPDFLVRVVTYDQDPTKEVALLRVSEGRTPPYMHSKDKEHRIYIRVGAQKTEADYLQISNLIEKRKRIESQAPASTGILFGSGSNLYVPKPPGSNLLSPEFFKFVFSPLGIRAHLRLNFETERIFRQCIVDVLQIPQSGLSTIRSKDVTIFRVGEGAYLEQRFGLDAKGGVGFVSMPGIMTNEGLFFVPADFCRYLLNFLSIASLFYERTMRFSGSSALSVALLIPDGAKLFPGIPTADHQFPGAALFHPPIDSIRPGVIVEIEVAMHPTLPSRLHDYLEAVLIEVGRPSGSVLDPSFRSAMQPLVDSAVARLTSARSL